MHIHYDLWPTGDDYEEMTFGKQDKWMNVRMFNDTPTDIYVKCQVKTWQKEDIIEGFKIYF